MVYLIFGNDPLKGREQTEKLVAQFSCKGDLFRVEFREDNFSEGYFNEAIKTDPLFGKKSLVVCKKLFGSEKTAGFLSGNIEKCSVSANIFIFLEGLLKKEYLDGFKKNSERMWEFKSDSPASKKQAESDRSKELFPFCDSLAMKRKHDAWVLFQNALYNGIPEDEIFKKVFWQLKTLLTVKKEGGIGMHPFFYKKNKKAASFFSEAELKKHLSELVELYHKDRYGFSDLASGLEKFIFKI